jgi:hypothetical protein
MIEFESSKANKEIQHFRKNENMKTKLFVGFLLLIVSLSQIGVAHSATASQSVTLYPIANATCSNYGQSQINSSELIVGRLSGVGWESFLLFNFSEIPTDATIQLAQLMLKSDTFTPSGSRYVEAQTTAAVWTENTINWDNKPATDTYMGTEWVELLKDWTTWDCTYELKSGQGNVSIALDLLSGMDGYIVFYSRQSDFSPKLEVTYSANVSHQVDPLISVIATVASLVFLGGFLYLVYFLKKRGHLKSRYSRPPTTMNQIYSKNSFRNSFFILEISLGDILSICSLNSLFSAKIATSCLKPSGT